MTPILKYDADFERFYSAYPRKVAKPQARKNFATLTRLLQPQQVADLTSQMIVGIDKHKKARAKAEGAGGWVADWPHPATFISQRRWEDEIADDKPLPQPKKAVCGKCGSVTKLHAWNGGYICQACYLSITDLTLLRESYKTHGLGRRQDETAYAHKKRLVEIAKRLAATIGKGRHEKAKPDRRKQDWKEGACFFCNGEGRYRETDDIVTRNRPAQYKPCPACATSPQPVGEVTA